jgi:hypothetical protein
MIGLQGLSRAHSMLFLNLSQTFLTFNIYKFGMDS